VFIKNRIVTIDIARSDKNGPEIKSAGNKEINIPGKFTKIFL
tara:strand:- start:316 stop:441 length:126 start_codon:yes stop_codon:yes gene_type:complete